LVFGCAGRVDGFDSTFPSIIEGNFKKDVKDSLKTPEYRPEAVRSTKKAENQPDLLSQLKRRS